MQRDARTSFLTKHPAKYTKALKISDALGHAHSV
jgi:hypothetical protein